ncbi:deoxyribodipyrimidine photo-lyase Phr1, putative [Paecilomyces variotii No. 5]|uniref:Deoxyribodipyrimidine photo-lyase Phr1, putative n=1 Tax=Byssochlamys spectabilis (strain No. 5 / NBRC 109023) TaxID=1356009 RepID=V5HUU5_BYSSN|nr:deoxyribodipyrimidine photo-lyase Phr1, putative [Paecilomyces variotii No. 5]
MTTSSSHPSHSSEQPQQRKLLIPSKRALLPISSSSSSSSSSSTSPSSTNNPSAHPAEIQIRRPAFSSAEPTGPNTDTGPTSRYGSVVGNRDASEPIVIEFDSSRAPQPFLDPVALEKVRARVRMREAEEDEEARRRREREAEYGGMAVRERSRAVVGRGGRR